MFVSNAALKSIAGAALAMAMSATLHSQSQNPPASTVDFGMIGLAATQTLRLSIAAYPPTPIFPPTPICVALIGFVNSGGGSVGPVKTVILNPGQGDFLDLVSGTLGLPTGARAEVRPAVTLLQSPAGGSSACQATAEIVDSASAFSLALAPGATEYPPTPVFGLQGAAWGQVLRLNAAAPTAAPCIAELSFVDRLGNPAGPAPTAVNLSPGQAAFLDVAGASLVPRGQRAELRPVLTTGGAAAGSVCAATAETYDVFTGRTWSWIAAGGSQ